MMWKMDFRRAKSGVEKEGAIGDVIPRSYREKRKLRTVDSSFG